MWRQGGRAFPPRSIIKVTIQNIKSTQSVEKWECNLFSDAFAKNSNCTSLAFLSFLAALPLWSLVISRSYEWKRFDFLDDSVSLCRASEPACAVPRPWKIASLHGMHSFWNNLHFCFSYNDWLKCLLWEEKLRLAEVEEWVVKGLEKMNRITWPSTGTLLFWCNTIKMYIAYNLINTETVFSVYQKSGPRHKSNVPALWTQPKCLLWK